MNTKFKHSATPIQEIPAAALRFAAELEFAEAGAATALAAVPVKMTARSKQPVNHWYWGRMVHDMAGFSPAKPTIPIDYCHDTNEVMGFAHSFDIGSGDLVAIGSLTPFKADDRASEVIFKSSQKVPYQASIYFDPDALVLEFVPEKMTAEVNGYAFEGPGIIARQWTLHGLAVCPYGQDGNTSVEFSADDQRLVAVKFAASKAPPAADPPPSAGGAHFELSTDPTKPAEKTGQDFLTAFGDKGGVWFAQGKTFDEARAMFAADMQAENERLAKENKELTAKLTASRGEKEPVAFDNAPEPTPLEKSLQTGLPKGLARFAAGLAAKRNATK